MPITTQLPSLDVPNLASKLPRPLQWPVGAILGGLKSVLGGDDPAGGLVGMAAGDPLPLGKVPLAGTKMVMDQAEDKVHPAVRALVDMLSKSLGEPELGPAMGRVTPLRQVPGELKVPEGFSLPKTFDPAPFPQNFKEASAAQEGFRGGFGQSPLNALQQVDVNRFYEAQPRRLKDPRSLFKGNQSTLGGETAALQAFPEIRSVEQAPSVGTPEDLAHTTVNPRQVDGGQAPLIQSNRRYKSVPGVSSLKTLKQLTPEEIKIIQMDAAQNYGTGKELSEKYGVARSTIDKVKKLPWKD